METRADRTIDHVPVNAALRGAGVWIAIWTAIVAQDMAGLNNSDTVPLSYRVPAKALCYLGASFLALAMLAWCEKRLNKSTSANVSRTKLLGATVLVALCIAAPIIEYFVSWRFLK
jgi:hypothetical protein